MRIIYLWDADYPWDVRTEKVCAALVRAGHDVRIVARNRGWRPVRETLAEGTVHRMPPWRWLGSRLDGVLSFPAFFNPRWITHLGAVVREFQPDVIIVRDLPLCPTALVVARRTHVPVILDMAEHYPAMMRAIWDAGRQRAWDLIVRNPALVSLVERHCVARVARTLVVVEESGERLRRMGVEADRITLVSNTPPRSHARRMKPTRSGAAAGRALEVIYLGIMEIPRGVGDLLRAIHLLKAAGTPVRLRLVGDGRDLDIFRELAARLGIADEVDFRGYVARREALALIAEADVGVVPHHADEAWNATIPNKLFDYMAAGLPVVSSDARPCVRVLEQTGAGLLYRSGDAASLSGVLRTLTDAELREELGDAGRVAVLERYNWERDTERLLEAVEAFGTSPRSAKAIPPRPPIRSRATR